MRIFGLLLLFLSTLSSFVFAQDKKKIPLHPGVYDQWNAISHQQIAPNGSWVSWERNPQQGDGNLFLYDEANNNKLAFPRGYSAAFSPESDFLVLKIKPQYDTIRKLKLADTKADKLPKDSLIVRLLSNGREYRFQRVKDYLLPRDAGQWMAIHFEKELPVKDTLKKKKVKHSKAAKTASSLLLMNPQTGHKKHLERVTDYAVARNGKSFVITALRDDTSRVQRVYTFHTNDTLLQMSFEAEGSVQQPAAGPLGQQTAFLFSADTGDHKRYSLYGQVGKMRETAVLADSSTQGMPEQWCMNENGGVWFSKDGERLFAGLHPQPQATPKDSLLDEEKARVDVWNYRDGLLQPMQLKQLEKEQKRSWQSVYHIKQKKLVRLADEWMRTVKLRPDGQGDVALGISKRPYWKELSWDDTFFDLYEIDLMSGQKTRLATHQQSSYNISPGGHYIYWYSATDSAWLCYSIKTKQQHNLTAELGVNFYNEDHDMPALPGNYGVAGWTLKDAALLIYDRYDIWQLDPEGKEKPLNLTRNGREKKLRYRYVKPHRDAHYIDLEKALLLQLFQRETRQSGYARLQPGDDPEILVLDDFEYSTPLKARFANRYLWRKGSFEQFPELHSSDASFGNSQQLSHANPQQDKYLWGSVAFFKWQSFNQEPLTGLLYKPENFDPNKKYPLLIYFYEKYSDRIHRYYPPKPSRSIINFSYCASNDYLVFVPDIVYTDGYPGASAYNAVISGVQALTQEYPCIDTEHMGIQGQSWGGYQVAYLVTQTQLFKAAMAGAPVSNMTSAYGGIRWGSGMSRAFQYEKTQSRLGGTLWEKPLIYLENSPLFGVPRIETPLLIMHNDGDGAVPWYQGIELFCAMRRLNKPVWMLNYNGDAHNLKRRANMKDLDIRMMQFFDHYLKGAPQPSWMKNGVPAIKKGIDPGYSYD